MEYENDQQGYEDDRAYANDRERSRSPRPDNRGNGDSRMRSASPGAARDRSGPPAPAPADDEEEARNGGTNLFVTGIHPRLTEQEVTRIFEKYGEVEKANVMRDPRTGESRGFGFVNMMTSQQADAAKEGLQGEVIEGRTLSIEKARRSRPRTPTPGKYFGPPKRDDDFRGPPRRRYDDRGYDDRRGGGGYGGRRDDGYRSRNYDDRRDDRGYGRRDDRGPDRRDDRYGGRDDRGYGGGRGGDSRSRDYERGPPRDAPAGAPGAYAEPLGAGRDYGDRSAGDDRYARR